MSPSLIILIGSSVLLVGLLIALFYMKKTNTYKYSIYTKKKKNVEDSLLSAIEESDSDEATE